ncbi:MAG: hypothetical protein MK116_13545 [Phycisphaerales bacterium]|nr:hypothetical protein [Phycisphaerales bacterium]
MRFFLATLVLSGLAMMPTPAIADDPVVPEARQSVRLKSGKVWRGRIGDVITVEWKRGASRPKLTGTLQEIDRLYLKVAPSGGGDTQLILVDYITSLTTDQKRDIGGDAPAAPTPVETAEPAKDTSAGDAKATGPGTPNLDKKGMFILPLSGTVGIEFRPEEIEEITRQADARGPGQTIVLEIDSGGGLVAEGMIIMEKIFDACDRHTVVAWVDHAISGASWTALCCDLIVFKKHGHTGGITIMIGNKTAPEATVMDWLQKLEKLLVTKNRPKYWARPFVLEQSYLSATKDPDTGEVKWFDDLSGERVFSGPGQNLMFNASEAEEYGFSYGTANTPEELAELLDLPEGSWELAGNGQELHDQRYELKDRFMKATAKDHYRLGQLGNTPADINKRIKIFESWLLWWKRVPNQCRMTGRVPSKDQIKQLIEEQRYLLRQMSGG